FFGALRRRGCRAPTQAHPTENAESWSLKSRGTFVSLVEQIIDPGEERDALVEIVLGGQVDDEIGISVQALNRKAAVPVYLRANVEHRRRKREPIDRQPACRQARFVFRPP